MLNSVLVVAHKEIVDGVRDVRAMTSSLFYALMGPLVVGLVATGGHAAAKSASGPAVLVGMMSVFVLVAAFCGGMSIAMDTVAGLFYGGGMTVLMAQLIGSAIVTLSTFGLAMVLMYGVKAMGLLRVSEAGEMQGLDLHEHGISAYPEYVISSVAKPAAMVIPEPKVAMEAKAAAASRLAEPAH